MRLKTLLAYLVAFLISFPISYSAFDKIAISLDLSEVHAERRVSQLALHCVDTYRTNGFVGINLSLFDEKKIIPTPILFSTDKNVFDDIVRRFYRHSGQEKALSYEKIWLFLSPAIWHKDEVSPTIFIESNRNRINDMMANSRGIAPCWRDCISFPQLEIFLNNFGVKNPYVPIGTRQQVYHDALTTTRSENLQKFVREFQKFLKKNT